MWWLWDVIGSILFFIAFFIARQTQREAIAALRQQQHTSPATDVEAYNVTYCERCGNHTTTPANNVASGCRFTVRRCELCDKRGRA